MDDTDRQSGAMVVDGRMDDEFWIILLGLSVVEPVSKIPRKCGKSAIVRD